MAIDRREFIKISALLYSSFFIGCAEKFLPEGEVTSSYDNFFTSSVGKQRLELIVSRQAGLYRDDKITREDFKLVSSDENPMIKRFYKEFAHHPLSEVSENLLHTHYIKRK